jgi:flagellar assembly factor FliW
VGWSKCHPLIADQRFLKARGHSRVKRGTEMNLDKLGRIPIKDDSILTFAEGLFGFETDRRFALVTIDEMKPFQWLVGVDEPGINLIVVDPYLVDQSYTVTLDSKTLAQVKAKTPEEVVVYAIATAGTGESATVNLKAPVLINPAARCGAQIHLHDDRYGTRHPIGAGNEVRASA